MATTSKQNTTTQPTPSGALTIALLLRILLNLIDSLSSDMLIKQARRTPTGLMFTVTSRTRPGHAHTVHRTPSKDGQHPTFSCTCEHGLRVESFTPANRHDHCRHVRLVHFFTLPVEDRRKLLAHPTGNQAVSDHQTALRAVWADYIARRRAELSLPAEQRPAAAFVYRLAGRQPERVPANAG